MKIGKLSQQLLNRVIFQRISRMKTREEVIVRAGVGEDCAAVFTGREYCVLTADPITGAEKRAGFLAMHVNANDIAAGGCEPFAALLTILLPASCREQELEELMDELCREADKIGVEIIGGHTEITDAVSRVIICTTMIGKTSDRKFLSTASASAGQDIVLTKWAGLEGTAILADMLGGFAEEAATCAGLLSVTRESAIARRYGAAAMHDATEGGVLGACYELAEASGTGIEIYADNIAVLDVTREICRRLGLDPLRLIASGALVIAAWDGQGLADTLKNEGIHAAVIGKLTDGERFCVRDGVRHRLDAPGPDEVYKGMAKGHVK
ncbi:MAG: AIR synthase family protein [Clostridiales bacterium]|nr:AIR synthase family protein [Clostridiales bacterium]